MLLDGFTATERQVLAEAVVESATGERRILVANCRAVNVSYPSIPHSKRSFAYRPVSKVPIGKADGPHLGTENWLPNGRKGSAVMGEACDFPAVPNDAPPPRGSF